MAKQSIYIGTKSGNDRVEKAIPRLMKREGMKLDQATAAAIRMESLGRLGDMGGARKKPVNPAIVVAAAMAKKRQPKKTREKIITKIEAPNVKQYKRKVARTRTTKPKRR